MTPRKMPTPTLRKGSKTYELRCRVGSKIVTRTLRTTDPKEAFKRAPRVYAELVEPLLELPVAPPSPDSIAETPTNLLTTADLCQRFRARLLEGERVERAEFAQVPVADPSKLAAKYRLRLQLSLKTAQDRKIVHDFAHLKWWLTYLSQTGAGDPADPHGALIALARTEVATLKEIIAADEDDTEPCAVANVTTRSEHRGSLSLYALFNEWKKHADQKEVAQSTIASYSATFKNFEAFLASVHRGAVPAAETVSDEDVERFAEHRAELVSKKTINGSDLAAIHSVYNWAVRRRVVAKSPAPSFKLKERRKKGIHKSGNSRKTLNEEEAKKILKHALNYQPATKREHKKTTAAKKWVPFLLAYTGTRVGEMNQLCKEDIADYESCPAIRVTSEAGTTKTGNSWYIPIHPHLIELGFLTFVAAAPAGHLFLTPHPERYKADAPETRTKDPRGILGPLKGMNNRIREFAREVMPKVDSVSPNHGWRHRFKSRGKLYGIDSTVLDAFGDHAPKTVGETYGSDDLFPAMVAALDKIPRYEI